MKSRSYPHRPPRLTYVHQDLAPFYFVTFNTYKRRSLLCNSEIHAKFREFCRTALDRNVYVGCYVIMPDHVHLFVRMSAAGTTLPSWIKALKSVLGKTLLLLGFEKPHWQEGFFDHVLRSGESYSTKWEYVRLNPQRAGLCSEAEVWPYQGAINQLEF